MRLNAFSFLIALFFCFFYAECVNKDLGIMSKKLFIIALPIMLQNLLSSSLSFVDTLMIGQLGQEHIAAVGIANQIYFLISLFFFGISSGTSIFLSQYYGSGEYDKMRQTSAFAFSLCLIGSVCMAVFSFICPEFIIRFFSEDPLVIESGSVYMRYVAFSYIFSAISSTVSIGFRAISKAQLPLLITFISLTSNAIGNYLLIFGIGPFPELGVAGAAIATFLSRLLEVVLLVYLAWRRGGAVFAFRSKKDFSFRGDFIRSYAKTSFPVLLNEVLWSLGMTLYKVAFARLGTEALATVNITESIANFFFVAMLGIGNGATILLGNTLGAGEKEKAKRWAKALIYLSLGVGVIMGLLEIALAPFFASLFNVSAAVALTAIASLRVNGVLQPIKSINMTTIVGILRAGGDTRYAMIAELIGVYFVGVPIAFIGASLLRLPLEYVYLLLGLEEATKTILSLTRIKTGKWANVLSSKKNA